MDATDGHEHSAWEDASDLRQRLRALFASQQVAVLATEDQGQPYVSLVAFVATDDLEHLLFATTRATRKFANLSANPRVALMVDNRSNRDADFHQAMAVTATGEAAEVEGGERQRLLDLYLARHPYLKDFVTAPSCALCRVTVGTYVVVTRFQHVVELHVSE